MDLLTETIQVKGVVSISATDLYRNLRRAWSQLRQTFLLFNSRSTKIPTPPLPIEADNGVSGLLVGSLWDRSSPVNGQIKVLPDSQCSVK
jgi:hypothetical protein